MLDKINFIHNLAETILSWDQLNERTYLKKAKEICKEAGHKVDPVGSQNKKTGTFSTMRKVGATCPVSCQYLNNGCYAQGGNVGIHEKRAESASFSSALAATIAIVCGVKFGKMARLHVSGDFLLYGTDEIDAEYIYFISSVCKFLDMKGYNGPYCWTYTHINKKDIKDVLSRYLDLQTDMVCLWSDEVEPGGTIVYDFDEVGKLRAEHPDLTFVKCLNQTTGGRVDCTECGLCMDSPHTKGRVIVFNPHGSGKKNMPRTQS